MSAGAQFLVSPCVAPPLRDHMLQLNISLLSGVATMGEVMAVPERGLTDINSSRRALPAARITAPPSGGHPASAVCPTGGVSLDSAPGYRAPECHPLEPHAVT
ncbi:hypothetical protein AB0N24_24760 [Arthrobacter sp. NPDC093128]|uniref:hypothetical protein n=1 Tax=Arthrobacter sp. NPDC093128 TaxID=3154979 RepID=UPI00343C52AF